MARSASMASLHDWKHGTVSAAKQEILQSCGDVSGIKLRAQQVLLGVHLRPAITAGGIMTVHASSSEDRWQGKIGLVLAFGPGAFPKEDVKIGDWVAHRAQDVWQVSVRGEGAQIDPDRTKYPELQGWNPKDGWPCRFIYGDDIYAVIDDPSIIV